MSLLKGRVGGKEVVEHNGGQGRGVREVGSILERSVGWLAMGNPIGVEGKI